MNSSLIRKLALILLSLFMFTLGICGLFLVGNELGKDKIDFLLIGRTAALSLAFAFGAASIVATEFPKLGHRIKLVHSKVVWDVLITFLILTLMAYYLGKAF